MIGERRPVYVRDGRQTCDRFERPGILEPALYGLQMLVRSGQDPACFARLVSDTVSPRGLCFCGADDLSRLRPTGAVRDEIVARPPIFDLSCHLLDGLIAKFAWPQSVRDFPSNGTFVQVFAFILPVFPLDFGLLVQAPSSLCWTWLLKVLANLQQDPCFGTSLSHLPHLSLCSCARKRCIGRSGASASLSGGSAAFVTPVAALDVFVCTRGFGFDLPKCFHACFYGCHAGGHFSHGQRAGARLRALNTCIGSSGTRASSIATSISGTLPFAPFPWLDRALYELFAGLLLLVFLSLCKLLFQCLPRRFLFLGRSAKSCLLAVPHRVLLPLGRVGGPAPCLDWREQSSDRHSPFRVTRQVGSSTVPRRISPLGTLFRGILCCSLPFQVWAAPPGAPEAVDALQHLAHRLPDPIPASTASRLDPSLGSPIATASVGFAGPGGPYTTAAVDEHWPTALSQPSYPPQTVDRSIAQRIAYPSVMQGNGEDGRLLGVIIFAPNYQTEIWAVHVQPDGGLAELRGSVQTLLADAFRGRLDRAVPIVPQLHDCCAQFVAYPSILDADGSLGVAVIFDLSRVGGDVFAAVVSRVLSSHDLIPFVRPLTRFDIEDFAFYIGAFSSPCAEGENVTLTHGTVIAVLPVQSEPPRDFAVSDLFRNDSTWTQIQHVPRLLRTPCLCVLSRKHRFVLRQDLHSGRTISEAVSVLLDAPADTFTFCSSFAFEDLDVQGNPCDRVVLTAPVPPCHALPQGMLRRDIWVFCDYRPLGRKPRGHLVHVFRVHVPSLLALDDIVVPEGYELLVDGGFPSGDEIIIGPKTTLVFRVQAGGWRRLSHPSPPDPPSSDDDDADDDAGLGPRGRWRSPPSGPSGPAVNPDQGDEGVDGRLSRSRSPIGSKSTAPADCVAPGSVGLRIPTPPLQCTTSDVSIDSGFALPAEASFGFPLVAKQTDSPGDFAHPVGADSGARNAHLQQLLEGPPQRDGPTFPVDPAELLRRRTRVCGDAEAPVTDLLVFVYAPQRIPEVFVLPLRIPCTVPEALQAVIECRDDEFSGRYPELVVADPQPDRAFATLLTVPAWAVGSTVVIFDCRRINGALFCLSVDQRLNRESLCLAAGLQPTPEIRVFVQGLPWALGAWQQVDLAIGHTVTFLPPGHPAPTRLILADMLFDSDHWDAQAAVPAPLGRHYLLLTDGISHLFTFPNGGVSHYRELIADQLRCLEQNLTLQGTRPRLEDVVFQGHHAHAVVVATEAISQLPVPPARLSPPQWIVALDLRDILRPFTWRLLPSDTLPVQALIREYDEFRPPGFITSVTGAPIEALPSGPVFRIRSGQLLRVCFTPDDIDMSTDPGHGQDGPSADQDAAGSSGSDTDTEDSGPGNDRTTPDLPDPAPISVGGGQDSAPDSSSEPVNVPVWFGILVPGFTLERIRLDLDIPTTIAEVITLLQQCRNPHIAAAFPGLVPATTQPDVRWGIFLALPIWGPATNLVCVDFYTTRQVLFAAPAPSGADLDILRDIAGLSEGSQYDLYVDSIGPIGAEEYVELHNGSTISLVEPGCQRPWTMPLSAMLRTHLPWDDTAAFPTDFDVERYVLACADGMRVFAMLPDRAMLYREDIASSLQCPASLLQLVPARPRPTDIAFFGFDCRTVLAALDRRAMRTDDRSTVGLLDARRVHKGWLPLVTHTGWLAIEDILEHVAEDLPIGWCARLLDYESGQSHVFLEEGAILVVVARRTTSLTESGVDDQQHISHLDSQGPPDTGPPAEDSTLPGAAPASSAPSDATNRPILGAVPAVARSCPGVFDKWSDDTQRPSLDYGNHWLTPVFAGLLQALQCWLCSSGAAAVGVLPLSLLLALWSTGLLRPPFTFHGVLRPSLLIVGLLLACRPVTATHDLQPGAVSAAYSAQSLVTAAVDPPLHGGICCNVSGHTCDVVTGARAIPTPARAGRIPCLVPDAAVSRPPVVIGELSTLLESSLAEFGATPFFLAATLLETLFEHFAIDAGDLWHDSTRTVVHLGAHLPTFCVHDVTPVAMRSTLDFEQAASLFSFTWRLPSVLPEGLRLHPATISAFARHLPASKVGASPISHIDVFTDGSFCGSISTWAFAVVARADTGPFLLAWAKGTVALPGQAFAIGALEHSAVNGERSALFWALTWLLGVDSGLERIVHSDCLVAAGQTNGRYGSAPHVGIAVACRALAQVLETLGGFTVQSVQHVRGHVGHPYNELADTLAGAREVKDSVLPSCFEPLSKWAVSGELSWLWLFAATLRQPQSWPLQQGSTFVDPHGNCTLDLDGIASAALFGLSDDNPSADTPDAQVLWLQSRFVSINVQSLCEDDTSSLPNRVPYVREQLEHEGCAVAALQETRAVNTSTVVSATHVRFLSARDSNGCFGVELWFSRTVPYGWIGRHPVYFDVGDFRVLHWAPRHLIVRFAKGSLRIVFVTCHAPTADHADRPRWWQQFVEQVIAFAQGDKVVILGDLNLRIVNSIPGRVGTRLGLDPDRTPDAFPRLLAGLDLWVPSTFDEFHSGPDHTWVAPGGASVSRIDYILIPITWDVPTSGSAVLHQVDFGQAGLDHYAVRLDVSVGFADRLAFPGKRRAIDVAKASSPEAAAVVADLCNTLPTVPWHVDAHRHYQLISDHLLTGLAEKFPRARCRQRRSFVSDTTWMFRQQRSWLRKQAHTASGHLSQWLTRCAFWSWSLDCALHRGLSVGIAPLLQSLSALRHAVDALRALKPQFRQTMRQDKRRYLSEAAELAMHSPTKQVVSKLRPLSWTPQAQTTWRHASASPSS